MSVRRLKQGEFKAAGALLQLAAAEEFELTGQHPNVAVGRALVLAHEVFVVEAPMAEPAERLVGIALARAKEDGSGEVSWVYVREKFREKGLASALVKEASAYLVENRKSVKINVFVFEANAKAQRLYAKLGFQKVASVWEKKP